MTSLVVVLSLRLFFDKFIISERFPANHVEGRNINEPSEFDREEVETLARPCLNMLNCLTYGSN